MSLVPALDLRPASNDVEFPNLPCNIEAEQAVLGSLMYDNSGYERVGDWLKAEHFIEPFHQRLYAVIEAHVRKGEMADPILLAERFAADPAFDELGGITYLADLVDRAPPAANAADYGRAVRDLGLRRELIRVAGDIAHMAKRGDAELDARQQIEEAEAALYALAETGAVSRGFVSFADNLHGAVSMAAEAFGRDGGLSGISSGLIDLDQKTGGLHKSDLIIIAARPSMGKTSLALNIAFNVAKNYAWEPQPDGTHKTVRGGRVGFFSLEMSGEQLAMRVLAEVSGVPSDRLRKGQIDQAEFGRVRDAALEIQEAPLYTDATGGISIAQLSARARRMKRRMGLDLVVVDYLQLMTASKARGDANRVEQITEITTGLKALAKELDVPVIALSQLSRAVEQREDKKPQLSDLRESGSIEQDADMVWFLYREAYYLSRMEPREGTEEHFKWRESLDQCSGLADLIIGKQRHGPIGTVKLSFNEELTKFGNLARGGTVEYGRQGLDFASRDGRADARAAAARAAGED